MKTKKIKKKLAKQKTLLLEADVEIRSQARVIRDIHTDLQHANDEINIKGLVLTKLKEIYEFRMEIIPVGALLEDEPHPHAGCIVITTAEGTPFCINPFEDVEEEDDGIPSGSGDERDGDDLGPEDR